LDGCGQPVGVGNPIKQNRVGPFFVWIVFVVVAYALLHAKNTLHLRIVTAVPLTLIIGTACWWLVMFAYARGWVSDGVGVCFRRIQRTGCDRRDRKNQGRRCGSWFGRGRRQARVGRSTSDENNSKQAAEPCERKHPAGDHTRFHPHRTVAWIQLGAGVGA
jgi:ABC-type nickel/cobalt efflux system permease component RcnA